MQEQLIFKDGLVEGSFRPKVLFVSRCFCTAKSEIQCHNFMELTFVLAGKGTYRLNQKAYAVDEGDLILVNPGVMHQSEPEKATKPLVLVSICFEGFTINDDPKNSIMLPGNKSILDTRNNMQGIANTCNLIWWEREQKNPGYKYMIRDLVSQLVIQIMREEYSEQYWLNHRDKRRGAGTNAQMITFVKHYLESNFVERLSLDSIARIVNLSPIYFSKLFKESTGISPVQYLIMVRLHVAKRLLIENPELSIQEIATKVGYDDLCHFSKMFKKRYGISPSASRR